MKKLFLMIAVMLTVNVLFSQENGEEADSLKRKHEVKINGFLLASSTAIDITYEYVANTSYGFGSSVLVNAFDREFPREKFSVTPFFRGYFFSKKDYGANGFFVEGFLKLASVKDNLVYNSNGGVSRKDNFKAAIGISVGRKWVNKNGFILELFLGMGRTLNNNSSSNGNTNYEEVSVLTRGGVTIGKRF